MVTYPNLVAGSTKSFFTQAKDGPESALYAAENDHVEEELSEKTIRPILNVHSTMITSASYFESFFACGTPSDTL